MTERSLHPPAPSPPRPSRFSPVRVAALAGNAFRQLARTKVFHFLLVFGLVVLGSSLFVHQVADQGVEPTFELRFAQQLKVLKDMSTAAMSAFACLFALAAAAMLLPKDTEDRTLYTILAKPVPRAEYLLGNYAGILGIILAILAGMSVLFAATLYLQQQALTREQLALLGERPDPEDVARIAAAAHRYGLNPGVAAAVAAIFLKAAVVAAFTLFLSTLTSSSLFTMSAGFAVFVIGHVLPLAVEYWTHALALDEAGRFLAAVLSVLFPNLQSFDVVDGLLSGQSLLPGTLPRLAGLAAGYVGAFLLMACFVFSEREL